MHPISHFVVRSFCLPLLMLPLPAHAEDATDAATSSAPPPVARTVPNIVMPQKNAIPGKQFRPINQPPAPMTIQRNADGKYMPLQNSRGVTTGFIPMPGTKFYPLPVQQQNAGVRTNSAKPAPQYADPTTAAAAAATEAARKQQVLDAARNMPTSLQPTNDASHGVRITRGSLGTVKDADTLLRTTPKNSATVPYGAVSAKSNVPKGASTIAPELRESAAERARAAGSKADPLDVLLQGR